MSLFLETIRVDKGEIPLIKWHEDRIKSTLNYFDIDASFILQDCLNRIRFDKNRLIKCSFYYNSSVVKIKLLPYIKKNINKLICTEINNLDYQFKYANRKSINDLKSHLEYGEDIIMIQDQRVKDTSYCNVALKQNGRWFTPIHPLLKGVRRSHLIRQGIIQPKDILITEIASYQKIALFNSMIAWDERIELPIENIIT